MEKLDQAIRLLEEVRDAMDKKMAPKEDSGAKTDRTVVWGSKVSPVFKDRLFWLCEELDINPDYLMACIAFESGETFRADIKNMAGSGATGLIQFMPSTALGLGTTVAKLAEMTPEDQLNFVYKYFRPYRGRLRTLEDTYMAILLPSMVGRPLESTLFSGGVAYRQNSGLDVNRDGKVTKAEASAKVREKLVKGEQFRG
jgi:hypothetical protein